MTSRKDERAGVAASLYNHGEWREVAEVIAAKYKAGNHGDHPIGHSAQRRRSHADGEYLGTKVPVALIVPFDALARLTPAVMCSVMNITQRDTPI